jgi:hypothetical protein
MRRPWPTGGCRARNKKTTKFWRRILFHSTLIHWRTCVFSAWLWQNGTSGTCCRKLNKWTYVLKCCICVNLNSYSWYVVKNRQESWIILFHQCRMIEWSSCFWKMCDHISQINPTSCTILFNMFIYFSSLRVSGTLVPIVRRKLLYLCDTGICQFCMSGVWAWIFNKTSRPDATHTELINTSVA